MLTIMVVGSSVLVVSGIQKQSFVLSDFIDLLIMNRSVDNREKDSIQSEKNHSIIFSYATKLFESCTAVKELHLEIAPNQVFTLLGPVSNDIV